MIKIYNNDCIEYLQSQNCIDDFRGKNVIIVTDPPFNIGYHYNEYKDKLDDEEYYSLLESICDSYNYKGLVFIHYPESLYKLSFQIGLFPEKVVSWVYNSNTSKQHRDIAFFKVKPIFKQVLQPYKNPTDKRIAARIAKGIGGGKLYDWWNINQVKNVSKKENSHPCVMPLKVMENIVGILPRENLLVFDPFMGSGTTGIACRKYNIDFVGCEINNEYYEIAKQRIRELKQ